MMDEFDKWMDDLEYWWAKVKNLFLYALIGFALVVLLAYWSQA